MTSPSRLITPEQVYPQTHLSTRTYQPPLNILSTKESLFIVATSNYAAIMSTPHTYYPSYPSTSYPINVPQKPGYYYPPQQHYGRIAGSPPEASDSTTTSGVPSYEVSATSSHYAGSHSDYGSTSGAASVDLLDYMGNRLNGSFDPLPLDRSLAKQAQT